MPRGRADRQVEGLHEQAPPESQRVVVGRVPGRHEPPGDAETVPPPELDGVVGREAALQVDDRVGVREGVAAHDEEIVGQHEFAPRDDEVGGRAFHRPDHRQHRLVEPAQAAVVLVVEGIGAERNDDLPARHGQPERRGQPGDAAVGLPELQGEDLDRQAARIAGRVVRQEEEVVVAAERVHARRLERTAGELPALVGEVEAAVEHEPERKRRARGRPGRRARGRPVARRIRRRAAARRGRRRRGDGADAAAASGRGRGRLGGGEPLRPGDDRLEPRIARRQHGAAGVHLARRSW